MLFVAALTVAPRPARALELGVRAGVVVDDSDPFFGLELLTPVGNTGWSFDPNVEFVDRGDGDRVSANLDFHLGLLRDQDISLWAGAGAAAIRTDAARGRRSRTDAGLNLLVGADWKLSGVTPYAQVKLVIADDSSLVAGVGIRF